MIKGHTELPSLVSRKRYYLMNVIFLSFLGESSPKSLLSIEAHDSDKVGGRLGSAMIRRMQIQDEFELLLLKRDDQLCTMPEFLDSENDEQRLSTQALGNTRVSQRY